MIISPYRLLSVAAIAVPMIGLGSFAARADDYVFNSNAGATANPITFSVGGGTGTLTGWEFSPILGYFPWNLYQKNLGGDEVGIGIAGGIDNEISNQCNGVNGCYGLVMIDLGASGSTLRNYAAAGQLSLSFDSVQSPDAGGVYYETTAPQSQGLSWSGPNLSNQNLSITTNQDSGQNPLTVQTTDEYLYITTTLNEEHQYSILLHDIETPNVNVGRGDPVPEPASFAMLGVGLLGIGFVRQRRRA